MLFSCIYVIQNSHFSSLFLSVTEFSFVCTMFLSKEIIVANHSNIYNKQRNQTSSITLSGNMVNMFSQNNEKGASSSLKKSLRQEKELLKVFPAYEKSFTKKSLTNQKLQN